MEKQVSQTEALIEDFFCAARLTHLSSCIQDPPKTTAVYFEVIIL